MQLRTTRLCLALTFVAPAIMLAMTSTASADIVYGDASGRINLQAGYYSSGLVSSGNNDSDTTTPLPNGQTVAIPFMTTYAPGDFESTSQLALYSVQLAPGGITAYASVYAEVKNLSNPNQNSTGAAVAQASMSVRFTVTETTPFTLTSGYVLSASDNTGGGVSLELSDITKGIGIASQSYGGSGPVDTTFGTTGMLYAGDIYFLQVGATRETIVTSNENGYANFSVGIIVGSAAVPEPSSMILAFGLSMGMAYGSRKRLQQLLKRSVK